MQLDPQLLRKTEARISQLVHELALKSRSEQDLESYLSEFLPVASSAMLSVGIAIWRWSSSSNEWRNAACWRLPVELIEGVNAEQELQGKVCLNPLTPSKSQLAILEAVDRDGQPVVVPPIGTPLPANRPSNPTEHLLIFSPIPFDQPDQRWLLQVVQRPCGGPATQRGYLRFVAQLADLIADFFKADRLRQLEREKELLQLSEKLLHRLSKTRTSAAHLRDLCDTFGHASQADQVFLAYRVDSKRTRWTLAAISGLDEVDPRAEGTEIVQRLVANLATAEQEESSLVSSKLLSPRIGSLHRDQDLENQHSDFFRVFKAQSIHWTWIHSDHANGQPQVAAVWFSHQSPRKLSVEQANSFFRLSLAASQVPWYRRLVAREKPSFQRRLDPTLWQTKTKWMTAIGILLTVAFIPVPMNVGAPATLHPSQIQNHYAPSDAIVRSIEADESGWIDAGQVFMKLEDLSLSSEIDEALGTIAKNRERITEIESRLLRDDRLPGTQRDPLESEAEMLKKSLDTQQKRLEYLMARAEKLDIRADFRGRFSHLNSKQDLTGRPVKRGQYLLSTHNPEGPWYVEARFREQDLPYIQEQLRKPNTTSAVLTSQPSEQFSVTWMTSATHAVESSNIASDKNFVVRFAIDPTAKVEFHDGNSARIQVRCGMPPLAWVLFRDFLQSAWSKVRLWI